MKMQLTLLFLLKDDNILLAMKKRGFGKDKWNGVGGKIELGETIEQAMIRESQEEIHVTPIDFQAVAELNFEEVHEQERKTVHVHVFTCTDWRGDPAESKEMKPQWFNIAEIPYSKMWSDDIIWLPEVLKGKKLRGDFILNDQNEVTEHKIIEVKEF